MKEFKFKPILGALPEMGATDWWAEEDWMRHNEYVARLKEQGKYLTEGEEITIIYEPKAFGIFIDERPFDKRFNNFGLMIPKGVANESIKISYKKEL